MEKHLPLFPEGASSLSAQVDTLFVVWTAVSIFFSLLIAVLIIVFMVKYRRRHEDQVGQPERAAVWLEVAWSVIPLGICLVMFGWGAKVYYNIYRPPSNAIEYWAVGKQWMWKFQHPDGHREINALHVPIGTPIKLHIQSEDVLHSFYVPAFRVKQDAVPGRETSIWFEATKPGIYHLFCAEYCGAEHSRMIGSVIAMEPTEYQAWMSGVTPGQSMASSGADLFQSLGCATCHNPTTAGMVARAPRLEGLYNHQVKLGDGRTLIADDNYIRESILNPTAKVVAGWQPIMPTFQGQVSEEQLTQLISYVRALGAPEGGTPAAGAAPTVGEPGGDTASGKTDPNAPPTAGSAKSEG